METKVTYVGLDVHRETIVAEWGQAKGAVTWMKVPNDEDGIKQLASRTGTSGVWGVYEASSCGFGLYDALTALGWKVSVVAPTHVKQSIKDRKRKNDRADARRLRELLVSHAELGTGLPTVWIPDLETRANREVARRRLTLGERISAVKSSIRSLLQMHGGKLPGKTKTAWTKKNLAALKAMTEEAGPLLGTVRGALASDLRELVFLQEESKRMHQELRRLAQEPRYQARADRMTRTKGVGMLTAMVYLVEMGDPARFRNRRQVACYLGLVPSSHESGEDSDRKGHITRMGPARIRKVLNQAAWVYLDANPKIRQWFQKVKLKRGAKRALVGVMRKLGIWLWHEAMAA